MTTTSIATPSMATTTTLSPGPESNMGTASLSTTVTSGLAPSQVSSASIMTLVSSMEEEQEDKEGGVENEDEEQSINLEQVDPENMDFDDEDEDTTPTSSKKPGKLTQGRRKIRIEYIQEKNRRHITFSKRKAGIMKKAFELSTLTGTQILLLVASETGHVYTYATSKLQPIITQPEGKTLIQSCLNNTYKPGQGNGKKGKKPISSSRPTRSQPTNTTPHTMSVTGMMTPGRGTPVQVQQQQYRSRSSSQGSLNTPLMTPQSTPISSHSSTSVAADAFTAAITAATRRDYSYYGQSAQGSPQMVQPQASVMKSSSFAYPQVLFGSPNPTASPPSQHSQPPKPSRTPSPFLTGGMTTSMGNSMSHTSIPHPSLGMNSYSYTGTNIYQPSNQQQHQFQPQNLFDPQSHQQQSNVLFPTGNDGLMMTGTIAGGDGSTGDALDFSHITNPSTGNGSSSSDPSGLNLF